MGKLCCRAHWNSVLVKSQWAKCAATESYQLPELSAISRLDGDGKTLLPRTLELCVGEVTVGKVRCHRVIPTPRAKRHFALRRRWENSAAAHIGTLCW